MTRTVKIHVWSTATVKIVTHKYILKYGVSKSHNYALNAN